MRDCIVFWLGIVGGFALAAVIWTQISAQAGRSNTTTHTAASLVLSLPDNQQSTQVKEEVQLGKSDASQGLHDLTKAVNAALESFQTQSDDIKHTLHELITTDVLPTYEKNVQKNDDWDWKRPQEQARKLLQLKTFQKSSIISTDSHKLLLLVPFREMADDTHHGANRTENLLEFVPYMINWLNKYGRNFRILIIEQAPGYMFNKGSLFNAGFTEVQHEGYDYLIPHDVDQVPMMDVNDYAYPGDRPRHLCITVSQNGFAYNYGTMVGGALAITTEQYKKVNGYSNMYWGWGGEDDDLYERILAHYGKPAALTHETGRYRSLPHPRHELKVMRESPLYLRQYKRLEGMWNGTVDFGVEGLNSVKYKVVRREDYGVCRIITVQPDFEAMPINWD